MPVCDGSNIKVSIEVDHVHTVTRVMCRSS